MKHRIPVERRALIQRLNRRLATEGQKLLKTRRALRATFGEYYVVDTQAGQVVAKRVDVEALSRKLRVLMPYEALQ